MKENYIITIGRQLGSGGIDIGKLLSERLAIPCYDRELLLISAQESGLNKEVFEKVDEKSSYSFLSNYFGSSTEFMDYNVNNYLSPEMLFKIQSDVILELAEKESCIFVGRCADYILRHISRRIDIFICASIKDRISNISAKDGLTEKEARSKIEHTDRKRAAYYSYFSNKTWGMASSYDLCLNSSTMDYGEIVSVIEEQVRKKFLFN